MYVIKMKLFEKSLPLAKLVDGELKVVIACCLAGVLSKSLGRVERISRLSKTRLMQRWQATKKMVWTKVRLNAANLQQLSMVSTLMSLAMALQIEYSSF